MLSHCFVPYRCLSRPLLRTTAQEKCEAQQRRQSQKAQQRKREATLRPSFLFETLRLNPPLRRTFLLLSHRNPSSVNFRRYFIQKRESSGEMSQNERK
jgi:hypothetical protein